jgi:hypothetical protein
MRSRSSGVLLTILLAALASGLSAQTTEPRLTIEKERVRLDRVTPGSRWLLLAYGRELSSPVSVRGYFQWQALEDQTRAGVIELDLREKPSPTLAVWAAYEVSTGRLLTAREGTEPPRRFDQELADADTISLADLAASEALLFVLRRGEGGWVWTGEADVDPPVEGELTRRLPRPEHFVPVSDAERVLLDYQAGDVFFAIDQTTLAVTVSRVP